MFSRGAADVQLKAAETGALMGTVIGGPMHDWTGCGKVLDKSSHIAANIVILQDDAGDLIYTHITQRAHCQCGTS